MKGLSLTVPIKRSDNDEGKFYLLLLLHLKSIAIHVKGKAHAGRGEKKVTTILPIAVYKDEKMNYKLLKQFLYLFHVVRICPRMLQILCLEVPRKCI
jgi:hypothetical protein